MILIADVDLALPKELHEHGSVQNLKDRRTDLFELELKVPSSAAGLQAALSQKGSER